MHARTQSDELARIDAYWRAANFHSLKLPARKTDSAFGARTEKATLRAVSFDRDIVFLSWRRQESVRPPRCDGSLPRR